MTKRRRKIIKDKKERGEWAELVFIARARENGLPASKPWGDSNSFDCVVGRPGKFVAVQVKCTVAKLENGKGYICSVCSSHKAYRPGAFDFLAAYVVLEDVWYIIPAKLICGLKSISLCTEGSEGKYEEYREAWRLLREASGCGESPTDEPVKTDEPVSGDAAVNVAKPAAQAEAMPMGPAIVRMQNAFNFFRRGLGAGAAVPQKHPSDVDPSG